MMETNEREDTIARLLKLAGPRPEAPETVKARVKASVRAEWQRALRRRERSRHALSLLGALSAAAMVVLIFKWGIVTGPSPLPAASVATIEWQTGAVDASGPLAPGATVETRAASRVALRIGRDLSLRVDERTRLTLVSVEELVLDRGAIYVDSGALSPSAARAEGESRSERWGSREPIDDGGGAPSRHGDVAPRTDRRPFAGGIRVRTPYGVVRDVGTQFEVRVEKDSLRVRVREGLVELDHRGRTLDASTGTEIRVSDDGEPIAREVSPYGASWAWVMRTSPGFVMEGRSLDAFLVWVEHETGLRVRFEDRTREKTARATILHGTLDDLTAEEALDAVLPTCGLMHRIQGGDVILTKPLR